MQESFKPHVLACKYIMHNINRLYFEQYYNIKHFLHQAVPNNLTLWTFKDADSLLVSPLLYACVWSQQPHP